jgi:acetyl esterase
MTAPAPVEAFLAAQPREPLDFLTLSEQRAFMRRLSDLNFMRYGLRPETGVRVTDHLVPTGSGLVRVRAYRPPAGTGPRPAHVFLHGGGWWLGSVDELVNDAICRHRALRADCVVLAVDYSLAPDRPFPAAVEEVAAVVRQIVRTASQWGIDPAVVSVGGVSAGGNLAAALTLTLRRDGGPRLVFQLLEVPILDLTRWVASGAADPDPLHAGQLVAAVGRYLPDGDAAHHELASPLCAQDLSGLPPARIFTAELDPLRVDGERYGGRLAAAGVPATVSVTAGAIHGTSFLTRVWPPAAQWQEAAADAVRRAHDEALAGPSTAQRRAGTEARFDRGAQ